MLTEWNALVADNVAQAAGATIRSLQRVVFAGMRALCLAGYRWALPRISSSYSNGARNPVVGYTGRVRRSFSSEAFPRERRGVPRRAKM